MTTVISGPQGPSSSGQTVSANVSSLAAKPRADATGNSPAEASVSSRKGRKTDKRSTPSSAGAGPKRSRVEAPSSDAGTLPKAPVEAPSSDAGTFPRHLLVLREGRERPTCNRRATILGPSTWLCQFWYDPALSQTLRCSFYSRFACQSYNHEHDFVQWLTGMCYL